MRDEGEVAFIGRAGRLVGMNRPSQCRDPCFALQLALKHTVLTQDGCEHHRPGIEPDRLGPHRVGVELRHDRIDGRFYSWWHDGRHAAQPARSQQNRVGVAGAFRVRSRDRACQSREQVRFPRVPALPHPVPPAQRQHTSRRRIAWLSAPGQTPRQIPPWRRAWAIPLRPRAGCDRSPKTSPLPAHRPRSLGGPGRPERDTPVRQTLESPLGASWQAQSAPTEAARTPNRLRPSDALRHEVSHDSG